MKHLTLQPCSFMKDIFNAEEVKIMENYLKGRTDF